MAIYETLRLWAALSPCQQRAETVTDDCRRKQEESDGEHFSRAIESCHSPEKTFLSIARESLQVGA